MSFDSAKVVAEIERNAAGQIVKRTTADGAELTYEYDARGDVVATSVPGSRVVKAQAAERRRAIGESEGIRTRPLIERGGRRSIMASSSPLLPDVDHPAVTTDPHSAARRTHSYIGPCNEVSTVQRTEPSKSSDRFVNILVSETSRAA